MGARAFDAECVMSDLLNEGTVGAYPQSYYAATSAPCPAHDALEGDHRYDVCVVGAGYTGLSAALFLAQRGFKVGVVEAHRVGWGASGRNGGQLGTGQRLDQLTLEKMLGAAKARLLWDLAEDGKSLVKTLIGKHQIACDLKPGVIYADHKKRFVKSSAKYVEALNERYDYDAISFLDPRALHHEVGAKGYFGGTLDVGAAHLHPLNYALGLARGVISAGADIFERSRVTEIVPGAKAKVKTFAGSISADHVIVACNGYLGGLEPHTNARVMPINSYMIATEPLDAGRASQVIRNDFAVADSRFVVNYFRLSEDKRMLFGGVESYGYGRPRNLAEKVRRRMLSLYPDLDDVFVDYCWGGTIGITMNRLPLLARPEGNVTVAAGYCGHGIGLSTLCGQLIGEAIAGQAERFDIMATLPNTRFFGGAKMRQPLLALAMLYYGLRDRL